MSTPLAEVLGEPEAETPVVETANPEAETPAEPEPQEQPEATAPETPEAKEEPKPDPQMVPVGVVQGLRQEIRELKAAIPQPAPEPAPDVLDDPEGYTKHMEKTVNDAVFQATMRMSQAAAVRKHGEDAVNAAAASINPESPEYQAMINSPDPFHELMEHTKRQKAMQEIGDDPVAYATRIKAEARAELEAEQAVKEVKAIPPATSLAANPNVGARAGPGWSGPTPLDKILGD
jgi:hypothetical protein